MENVIDFGLLKEYDSTLKEVLKVWQKQKSYSINDIVQYKGNYLKCTTAGTSGITTLDFTGLVVGDTITDGTVVWEIIEPPSGSGNGLNDWKSNTQYKIDDIVVNDGQIYKVLIEFTSGSTFENIEILEDYELQTGDTPIPWAEGIDINIGDIVGYGGKYYIALADFTCGSTFTKNVFEEYVPKSLTDAEVKEVINSYTPEFSGGTGGENYSTKEQRIGTWIDGKPLYQITIVDTMPVVPSDYTMIDKTIDISYLFLENFVDGFGFISRVPDSLQLPIVTINSLVPTLVNSRIHSSFVCIFVRRTNASNVYFDTLSIRSNNAADSNMPIYITIKYTKTTD